MAPPRMRASIPLPARYCDNVITLMPARRIFATIASLHYAFSVITRAKSTGNNDIRARRQQRGIMA